MIPDTARLRAQTEAILTDLVALTAQDLKKSARLRLTVSACCKFVTVQRAWDAIQLLARPSGSRPARRSPSARQGAEGL